MKEAAIIYYAEEKQYYNSLLHMFEKNLENRGIAVECIGIDDTLIEKGVSSDVLIPIKDYLISFDMAGFQLGTLLGDCVYNIRTAMQLHLLLEPKVTEVFPDSELALNLYMFVPQKKMSQVANADKVLNLIPYEPLYSMNGKYVINSKNEKIIDDMITYLLTEEQQTL